MVVFVLIFVLTFLCPLAWFRPGFFLLVSTYFHALDWYTSCMKAPTKRQDQILRYVNAVIKREGEPPTMQEIADFFQFKSKSASYSHLVLLEKKGLIHLTGARRGIEIL